MPPPFTSLPRQVRLLFCSLIACLPLSTPVLGSAAGWQVLENCRLVEHPSNDGDSFRVRHRGKTYIFRLYFIDAAETSAMFPARVGDQADYFDLSRSDTLGLGAEATRFTRAFLQGRLTVYTRWQDARGRSRMPRYYALVASSHGDLGSALVETGLARIYGFRPGETTWPLPGNPASYTRALERLESRAKSSRLGGWGSLTAAPPPSASTADEAIPEAEEVLTDKLNINRATEEALQALPGIGPVLANRISKSRPFVHLEEILEVDGIGKVKFSQIEGHLKTYDGVPPRYTADWYEERHAEFLNYNITVYVDYLEAMEEEDVPESYKVVWASTSYDGAGGGGIAVYIPEEMEERFFEYFGDFEAFRNRQATSLSGRTPPKALKAFYFAHGGNLVLVVRRQAF